MASATRRTSRSGTTTSAASREDSEFALPSFFARSRSLTKVRSLDRRKRVSIAEVALAGAPLALWDNSTRGLDSATAVSFCQTIKASAELTGGVACVAIYQAPQPAYECFSRAIVLYEGRSIYFGPASKAKDFWVARGFECPEQQTDPDFLTGLTSPAERRVRKGWENQVPRTPEEFERIWKDSDEYRALKAELGQYDQRYPTHGEELETFKASRRAQQAKSVRAGSPYTLSYGQQIALCLRRGFQRLAADPSLTFFQLFGNSVMALIVSSVFFNLQPVTTSFYSRGSLLFFSVLLNVSPAFPALLNGSRKLTPTSPCAGLRFRPRDPHPLRPTPYRRQAGAVPDDPSEC